MNLKVGCSGFAAPKKKYFEKFKVVEIESSLGDALPREEAEKLRREAPDNFEFTVRAEKECSLFRPTDEALKAWEKTDKTAEILKANVILFQSRDTLIPTRENKAAFMKFFRAIKRKKYIFAWESPKAWSGKEIKNICEKLEIVHTVDPFVEGKHYGKSAYFRLSGKEISAYRYSGWDFKQLRDFCEKESERIKNNPIYVIFNNVSMMMDAQRFEWIALNTGPIKDITMSFLKGLCDEIELVEEDRKVQILSREAEKIVSLILHTDYAKVDIDIEKEKLREMCLEFFPDKEYLYDMIYGQRFERLWEQFREEKK